MEVNYKRGGGVANGKYQKWLEPDGLLLLESWARDGLTDEQIAHNMGICRDTLIQWKKRFPDISDTLKKGKDVVDVEVENALLNLAKQGNITAIIFWLKNRKPDKWKDKPTTENTDILNKLDKVIGGIDAIANK